MNESEAHVMRLTEQAKILKEEIRRLERNVQREKETQNMEYLKNILMKVRQMDMLWISVAMKYIYTIYASKSYNVGGAYCFGL